MSNPCLSGDGVGGETELKWDLHILIHGQWEARQCFWLDGLVFLEICLSHFDWSVSRGSEVQQEAWRCRLGSGWLLPWRYTCPGPFQPTKLSWTFSFSKRPSLTIVTLASQTLPACTVCTTSFILPWLIDPHHAQGKRPFANIHVVKSFLKFGCRPPSWTPVYIM